MDLSAYPSSRSWMKKAFSTIRVASRIHLDAVAVGQCAQCLDVRHAHRLAAGHVHGAGQADVGDLLRPFALDQRLELVQIHVALERMQVLRVVRLIDDHIHEDTAGQLLMQAGRREVHVAGHKLTRLDAA